MRQVFTSQRVETVEGVAQMLRDAGIDSYVSNGRSYKGGRSGRFRYSEPVPAAQQPAVWVQRADDQPRARQILREAGLLDTTRPDIPRSPAFTRTDHAPPHRWGLRIRLILLAVLATTTVITVLRYRTTQRIAEQAARALREQPQAERVQITPITR